MGYDVHRMATSRNPEFEAFDHAMSQLLGVPRNEMKKRMEAYKKEADKNPKKRGPKKRTLPESDRPSDGWCFKSASQPK